MRNSLAVAFLFFHSCLSAENSVSYVKHAQIEDQESSGSGYAYQLHTGEPLLYTNSGGGVGGGIESGIGGGDAGLVNHFAYPPVQDQRLPLQLPLAMEYKPQTSHLGLLPINSYGIQHHPYHLHYPLTGYRYVPVSISDSSKFVKEGGSSFADGNKQSHGEKGSSGYKTAQQYDKGAEAKHANEGEKEYYSKEGANKAAHNEQSGHYGQKEEAAKGSQGSHFAHSKSHKKGSKTTGYHKVHHKDEYKKDHSFYDESDTSGHFNKHGDFDSHQASEKGGFEKGGHEDKVYNAGEYGAKGFVDKEEFLGEKSGFKGEKGKQAHFKNFEEYGKKKGEQEGKEYGFNEKDALYEVL